MYLNLFICSVFVITLYQFIYVANCLTSESGDSNNSNKIFTDNVEHRKRRNVVSSDSSNEITAMKILNTWENGKIRFQMENQKDVVIFLGFSTSRSVFVKNSTNSIPLWFVSLLPQV